MQRKPTFEADCLDAFQRCKNWRPKTAAKEGVLMLTCSHRNYLPNIRVDEKCTVNRSSNPDYSNHTDSVTAFSNP